MTPQSLAAADDRARDLQSLYELMDAVARAATLEDVYDEALRVVRSALGVDRASLLVADRDGVMRFRAWHGLSDTYRAGTEGHSPWKVGDREARPIVIEDVDDEPSLGDLKELIASEGISALVFVPLAGTSGVFGKFMLYYDTPQTLSEAELRLASTVAASVAGEIGRREVEAELRASRDQLAAIFTAVADGVTVLDGLGRFALANEAAARLCGFDSVEEMLATPTGAITGRFEILDEEGNVVPSEDLPGRRVLAGEPYAEMVLSYRRTGVDDRRWSHVKASPIRNERGEVSFAVSVFRDITKERELAVRERLRGQASALLGTTLDLPETLQQAASLFVPHLADWCAVHLDENGQIRLAAAASAGPDQIAQALDVVGGYPQHSGGERRIAAVLASGAPELVAEISDEMLVDVSPDARDLELLREACLCSLMVVPILGPDGPLGALTLASSESGRRFDEDDLALAVELSRSIALAIQNARLHAAERAARRRSELALTRLSRLEQIGEVVLRASDLDDLLERVVEVVRDVLGSDRATLLLLEGAEDLIVRASVGLDPEVASDVRVPLGHGIAGTIASTRTAWVIDDLSKVDAVSSYLRGGSLAGVPLLFQDRLLGVLHVSSVRTSAFGTEDLEYLKLAAERAAIAIERATLFERERDIAAALQHSLLPERFPRLPGITIAASYEAATDGARVGGDWYDAFPVGDGRVLVAIGDIVGHGIEAAAAMGQVRNALRAYAIEDPSPARVLDRINNLLVEMPGEHFCTAICALLDPWAATIVYSNAGHPAALAFSPLGGARFLEGARSTPLGALKGAPYENATDSLDPGSMLFAYTDGLVERRDQPLASRLELLSRVGRAAAELPLRRVPEFIGSSLLVEGEPREDDVAMIAIQLASADDLHLRLPAEPTSLAVVRRALDGYLTRAGATSSDIFDLKVACGEACTNVIEHAYGTRPGVIRLSVEAADGGVSISVRDTGEWRERQRPSAGGRGNGFELMRRLTDQLEVDRTSTTGTEVRMFRRLTR